MQNPWPLLPMIPPYVLPSDKPFLSGMAHARDRETTVRLDTLPYPYLGNPKTATVCLLALNGGFDDKVLNYLRDDPAYVEQRRKSLLFESDYPFFYLDPRFSNTLGYRWWHNRLRDLINQYGPKTIAEKVMCVQYFPYCSKTYKPVSRMLPSQKYSFDLVRQAITENKVIVIMRSRRMWLDAVPELENYPFIELTNPRTPYLKQNHMTTEQWGQISLSLQ